MLMTEAPVAIDAIDCGPLLACRRLYRLCSHRQAVHPRGAAGFTALTARFVKVLGGCAGLERILASFRLVLNDGRGHDCRQAHQRLHVADADLSGRRRSCHTGANGQSEMDVSAHGLVCGEKPDWRRRVGRPRGRGADSGTAGQVFYSNALSVVPIILLAIAQAPTPPRARSPPPPPSPPPHPPPPTFPLPAVR